MGERGQVLPLVALALVALMGFAGMAVDLGYLQYEQRQQQTAADAGALAGAEYELKHGGCAVAADGLTPTINADVARNGYTDDAGKVDIFVDHPVPNGPFVNDPCAVRVKVYSPHQTFFTQLFGMTGNTTTEATATIAANSNGCAFYLDPTQPTTFNGPNVYAPGCSIYTNNIPFSVKGGPQVTVAGLGYSQTYQDSPGTKYTEATPMKIPPATDPCMEIPGCRALTLDPPPQSPCPNHAANTPTVMNPGCYTTDFSTTGNVTLMPGVYVITGDAGKNAIKGNISGTGVTIYVAQNGQIQTTNGATLNITPPTTGEYAGVSYYQVPGNSSATVFNGTIFNVSGLFYAPSAENVTYNGQQRTYMVLVLGSATYNGNSTSITFYPPAPGQSLIQEAVLAQ